MKKDELARIQGKKLRHVVSHAFEKVSLYHKLYQTAGVDPDSITDSRSIARLPTISKEHLRTPLAERTAVDTDLSSCIAKTTSGSSGIPVTTLQDPRTVSYRAALWLRRFLVYGIGPQHKAYISIPGQAGASLFSSRKGLLGFVLQRKVRPLSLAADLKDHLNLLSTWKPDVLVAPPSFFRALITFCEETSASLSLKVALASGEALDGLTRKLIRDRLHADVFVTYGLTEVGGVAWECPTHSGYHINADSLVVEFLRDGEAMTAGNSGEICVTNLYNRATPIIRYRVGDMATPLDEDCPCGRGLPLMKNIEGRVVDYIFTTEGRHISPHTVMYTLENVPGIAQYKVTQRRDRSIELLVKTTEMKVEPILELMQQHCRQLFGDTPVSIKAVHRIEIPKGSKFKVVESQLNE